MVFKLSYLHQIKPRRRDVQVLVQPPSRHIEQLRKHHSLTDYFKPIRYLVFG